MSLDTQPGSATGVQTCVLLSELIPDVCTLLSLTVCPLSPTYSTKRQLEMGERVALDQVPGYSPPGSTSRLMG